MSNVLGMRIHAASYGDACERVLDWALEEPPRGRYVCAANVHMCMEAFDDRGFQGVVNGADMVVPDGKPLVWALRLKGRRSASQVRGSDLFLRICGRAEREGVPVGFYGGSQDCLADFLQFVMGRYPELNIPFFSAPPFRPLTAEEEAEYVQAIGESGVRILFVGLGCPKQEKWMAAIRDRVPCVMVGIGAAFDFFAGRKRHAPRWMQKAGIEWMFRLGSDPGRLWKRYLKHNPRFVWFLARELAGKGKQWEDAGLKA